MRLVYNYYWIFIAWIILILVISPWGEFPINDDWAYAKGAKNLAEGKWQYSDWQGMPFFTQQLWGAIWIKVFGFSFTALRLSTILLGAWGLYFTLKTLRMLTSFSSAFWLTVLLGFNPLYMHLSMSYMTDIPCLVLSLGGLYYLFRFKLSGRFKYLLPALIFIILGSLIRQFSILIPIGFIVGAAFKLKTNFIKIIFYIIITALAFAALRWHKSLVIEFQGKLPSNYGFQFGTIKNAWTNLSSSSFSRIAYYGFNALIFIGISLSPLTLRNFKEWNWKKALAFGLLLAVGILKVVLTGNFWPFTGDIFYPIGAGTIILDGFQSANLPGNSVGAIIFGSAIMILGSYSLANIVFHVERGQSKFRIELITIVILSILPLVVYYISDRYLLFSLAFSTIAIARVYHLKTNKWLLGAMILSSLLICASHFNFQKSRTSLIEKAENVGADKSNLDAGFEYNAWHNFNFEKYQTTDEKWWWVVDDEYVIRVTPNKRDYVSLDSVSYFNWTMLRTDQLFLLKRGE